MGKFHSGVAGSGAHGAGAGESAGEAGQVRAGPGQRMCMAHGEHRPMPSSDCGRVAPKSPTSEFLREA